MHPHSHFAATASLHLHALISDLHRRVRMLGSDIQEEERKAGNPAGQPLLPHARAEPSSSARQSSRYDRDALERKSKRHPGFEVARAA